MTKVSRNLVRNPKDLKKNFGFLRFLVIILSFISLISRIIYCTFATWLTITTFDCNPCPNITHHNTSSDLFVSHHSSASFKTIRGLNVVSGIKTRPKRSQDLNDSTKYWDNFSQFFINDDIRNQNNKTFNKWMENNSEVSKENESMFQIDKLFEPFIEKNREIDSLLDNSDNKSDIISSFFGEENDSFIVPVVPLNDDNSVEDTPFQRFTYNPNEDLVKIVNNLTNNLNISEVKIFDNKSTNDSMDNKMIIIFNDLNDTKNISNAGTYQKNVSKEMRPKNEMNVCSEDCSQFMNIELSDPEVRKWATIVITGVLYLYAFVMFCIFISSCLALVDLLVLSTFIEGAKLFAGFILIIIDSFNGREIHLDLIDIKFNVNSGGNGWTADFSYSEYLLDIIIFFLSALLSIRVFKCLERRPKKVSSIEELMDSSRGTYRPNPSRNSLEPIYEQN